MYKLEFFQHDKIHLSGVGLTEVLSDEHSPMSSLKT